MRLIVVLGAGDLGGALARHIAAAGIAQRIVLVDEAVGVAQGKALDIRQAAPVEGYDTEIVGSSDETAVVGADAVVFADKAAHSEEWQGDAAVALVRRVAHLNTSGLLLCAGAAQIELVERGVREGGLDRRRLFGSAPEALRAAVISIAALEAGCTPGEIGMMLLGRPPDRIIVPWDEASIGGRRATDLLPPPAITRLDARLPWLWPPGPLTLAAAATGMLRAAAERRAQTFSAFVAVTREEGAPGRAVMLPVTLSRAGIAAVATPTLSARDRVRLETVLRR